MDFEYERTVLTPARAFKTINPPRAKANTPNHIIQEEFRISGDALIHKIEELITQRYIRRIKIQNKEGYTLLAIPINRHKISGDVSSFNVPEVTAARVIAAMVAQPKVIVEWQVSCPVPL